MNVYKEIEKIAKLNSQINDLISKISEKIDADGLNFRGAYFIEGCIEKSGHLYDKDGHVLDNSGLVDNDYYCEQYIGGCGDDFYGTLYFSTKTKGLFVAIPFWM